MRAGASSIAPKYHTRLALWANRPLPRCATSDSWRSLRSARGPPVHYRDKPVPTPKRGSDWMPIRGPNSMPFDTDPAEIVDAATAARDRLLLAGVGAAAASPATFDFDAGEIGACVSP